MAGTNKAIIGLIMAVVVSGCSVFTEPRENPFLVEYFEATNGELHAFGAAATDANRRLAIFDMLYGQICIEPPPEAANVISEAFTSLLKAAVESGDSKKAEIAGNMSRSVSQNISQLYRRTQTVQLYRDSVFALCQSAINGTMAIADGTRANIKPDTLQKIRENEKISQWLEEKSKNDPLVKGLLENEPFSSDVLRKFDEIPFDFKKKEKSEVKAIKKKLAMGLKMAEFKRRLVDGLKEAFDRLEEELPMFYETEKLRFLTELGKPIQVCETETTSEQKAGDTEFVETKKVVTCKTKFPENFDQVIKEYLDSSTPEKK